MEFSAAAGNLTHTYDVTTLQPYMQYPTLNRGIRNQWSVVYNGSDFSHKGGVYLVCEFGGCHLKKHRIQDPAGKPNHPFPRAAHVQ